MRGNGILNIGTELIQATDGKVRMIWKVKNIGSRNIRIISYYCPFFKNTEEKGVYVRGRWIKDKFRRSDDHVITYLYPEESRNYVWAWVDPQYYGIYKDGNWHYELELQYSMDAEVKIGLSRSNTLEISVQTRIPQTLGPLSSPSIIKPLVDRYPRIKDYPQSNEIQTMITPTRPAMIPDAFLIEDTKLLVIEIVNYVTQLKIEQLEEIVEHLEEYAISNGLSVEGVIVALEIKNDFRLIAENSNITILKMTIPDHEI